MRTTIKDIATYTGLSITTISLVLNRKGIKIPQKTKDIVLKAAEELNYRPNQIAVGLVKKRTKTIGLIISDIRNEFFSNLAKGVEDECRKNGWNLILCNTNDKHERDMDYINVLADKGVDGIVFGMSADSSREKAKECIGLMEYLKIPYIMIDRTIKGVECCAVVLDHQKGGYMATKHLIDLGHTRIACVTGPLYLVDAANRLLGYKQALKEASIPYDLSLVFKGNYTIESGMKAVDYLEGKNYSAIFAFNDMTAYGVYKQLKKYNRTIPDEISVVGYDNIFFSEILDVPLTTINQPIYDMGVEAARQIINMEIKKESLKQCVIFQPSLIIRESTRKRE